MALSLPVGVTPSEIQFLCEMEMVTVVPRQRLESLDLLSIIAKHGNAELEAYIHCSQRPKSNRLCQGPTPTLKPPTRTSLSLWLALLLHRQKRAQILPPPWLTQSSLSQILEAEINDPAIFSPSPQWTPTLPISSTQLSPPFLKSSTAEAQEGALPYHYLELSELLLSACADSMRDVSTLRGLVRDIREVRASKLREGMKGLEGGGVVSLRGVGAMEVFSERAFLVSVTGGLRMIGASKEIARREREEGGDNEDEGSDDEMEYGETQ